MSDIPFILSLAYRKQIDEACKPLSNMGLKHFVMYIVFNDSTTFVLSNVYPILKSYYQDALYKEDYTYTPNLLSPGVGGYYLCDKTESLSTRLKELFAEKYNMHPTYNIVRKHTECTFVFSAITDRLITQSGRFYEETIKEFETFCINFVDTFLDLIINCNPSYRFSFILTNKALRDAVIRQGYEQEITLSLREQECLLLAAQGKKPKHIAKELNISPYTVEEYLKHIRKILNCDSIAQAMYESIQRGIIGKISSFNRKSSQPHHKTEMQFARPI